MTERSITGYIARMTNDRLKDRIAERLAALGISGRAASLDAGFHPDTIRNALRDRSKKPRADTLIKLSRILRCPVDWLAEGIETAEPGAPGLWETPAAILPPRSEMRRDVPVLGTAAGSLQGSFQVDAAAIDYVRRPPGLEGARDIYALYVVGSSMSPRFEEGELVYVSERRPARIGDYVVVQTLDGSDGAVYAYCKRLRRRGPDTLVLEQLNPAAEIVLPLAQVRAVHRILTLNELFGA